ncbi:unnamed protein product [Haemonchus placei]|uniref:UmuC domain-containing protein n=1 Tax=Haemonchus placei TaxID=6290 RepID=A0A158QKS9_HAEPC|nr:unnamed protein product [Haemonchus placei]
MKTPGDDVRRTGTDGSKSTCVNGEVYEDKSDIGDTEMVSEAMREENFAFWNGETIVDEMLDSEKGVSSPENRAEVSKPSCSKESSKPEVYKYPKTNEPKSAEGKTNDNVRARLDDSLSRMQNDNMEGKSSFGRYMRLKKDKLRYQVNVQKTRQNETFLKPDWVVDCIAAGRLLEVDKYILLPSSKERSIAEVFSRNNEAKESSIGGSIFDARDPKFLEEYYARSRLHLISTLAQEMKDWVKTMRETDTPNFSGRVSLKYLSSPDFVRLASKIIFHIDLDCFFVSVALRDRPDLIGKPVAITHSKGVSAGFSELASVSYAAREYGLRNGMIVRDAIKLCPNLVCLPYLFDEYRAVSKAIYTIVARYTLEIRAVSCDEMYVDCTKFFDEYQGQVLIDGMVNLTEVVVHSKTNFVEVSKISCCSDAARKLISQDRHVTNRRIGTTLGIEGTSIHLILRERSTVKKLIPQNLSFPQKKVLIGRKKCSKNTIAVLRNTSMTSRQVMDHGFTRMSSKLQIADPVAFAEHLRAEVRRETGCPASIGIGMLICFNFKMKALMHASFLNA